MQARQACRPRIARGRGRPRLSRGTYALLLSLLPAAAACIGVVVLRQVPTIADLAGIALVVVGIAVHREPS